MDPRRWLEGRIPTEQKPQLPLDSARKDLEKLYFVYLILFWASLYYILKLRLYKLLELMKERAMLLSV